MMDGAAIALAGTGSDSEIVIEELGRRASRRYHLDAERMSHLVDYML
jgi:hypothetical protein